MCKGAGTQTAMQSLSGEKRGAKSEALMLTFVPAELYISKQADLDDLPEEAQHQVGLPGHEIMGIDAHHRAADGRSRVQSQHQVLLQRASKPVRKGCTMRREQQQTGG